MKNGAIINQLYAEGSLAVTDTHMLNYPNNGVSLWLRKSNSPTDNEVCYIPETTCFFEMNNNMEIIIEYSTNAQAQIPSNSKL